MTRSAVERTRLGELGEEKLLAQILPRLPGSKRVVVAAGDDCAVVRFRGARDLLVLKSDCVVEDIHFISATPATAVGWKAMMRALSDFAAMAAVPEFALITLVIAANKKQTWVRDLYRGLNRAARHFDVSIVGGETSATTGNIVVTVSIAGYVEVQTFSHAKPAEKWVTISSSPETRWLDSRPPLEFCSPNSRISLACAPFQCSRHDRFE